jgi:hypothetical protein
MDVTVFDFASRECSCKNDERSWDYICDMFFLPIDDQLDILCLQQSF